MEKLCDCHFESMKIFVQFLYALQRYFFFRYCYFVIKVLVLIQPKYGDMLNLTYSQLFK